MYMKWYKNLALTDLSDFGDLFALMYFRIFARFSSNFLQHLLLVRNLRQAASREPRGAFNRDYVYKTIVQCNAILVFSDIVLNFFQIYVYTCVVFQKLFSVGFVYLIFHQKNFLEEILIKMGGHNASNNATSFDPSNHTCTKTQIDQVSNRLQMAVLSIAIILNCTGLLAIKLHRKKTNQNLILSSLSLCELLAALRGLIYVVVVDVCWDISPTFKRVLVVVQTAMIYVLVLTMWIIAIDR